MAPTEPITAQLTLAEPGLMGRMKNPIEAHSPNQYFQRRFPSHTLQFGPAFLELRDSNQSFLKITPLSLNIEFFASIFSDPALSLRVVYFAPEMQFYYCVDLLQPIFKPVSPEKLMSLYRGLLIRCAKSLSSETNILNLFEEFRSDKVAKTVIQRAKSILAADPSFFSATSPHQRLKGPELHERLILNLVETMLAKSEGACLTVTQAYQIFCRLSERRGLGVLKRSTFRELMRDCVRDRFDLALRHDVPDSENKHQQAWKGLKLIGTGVEVA